MAKTIEAHVLNIGLGNCNLFITPEKEVCIIDLEGGSLSKRIKKPAAEFFCEYFSKIVQAHSIPESIDHLFASHIDADHFGNRGLLSKLTIDEMYFPPQFQIKDKWTPQIMRVMKDVMDNGYKFRTIGKNNGEDIIPSSEANLDAISPPAYPSARPNKNDGSLCLVLSHGDSSILFPGDIETQGVNWLTSEKKVQDIDCIVAPHHGSGSVDYGPLFNHCDPDYVFVSSAHRYHDGRYDHPAWKFLREAKSHGCKVYWTAVHGHIVATSNGVDWRISTQETHSTDPSDIGNVPVSTSDLCNFSTATVKGYPETF